MIHALKVEYATGYVSFRTYPDQLTRAIEIILLSSQPVILTPKDYDDDALTRLDAQVAGGGDPS